MGESSCCVVALYRYPLQGAQGQAIDRLDLKAYSPPPFDRVMGIVEKIINILPDNQQQAIYKLRTDRAILTLRCHYDEEAKMLEVYHDNQLRVRATLPNEDHLVADYVAKLLGYDGSVHPLSLAYKNDDSLFGEDIKKGPAIVGAYKKTAISLINLHSVRALATRAQEATVDEKRFRANIYIDNMPPFEELTLLGKKIQCGSAILQVIERTARCAITEVNPTTGQRDFPTLKHLKNNYQHLDMGVYAEIIHPGVIKGGDSLQVLL